MTTVQPSQAVLFAVVGLPFLGAAVTPLLYRVLGERTAYAAAAIALACFGLVASQFGTHGTVAVEWIPSYDVSFALYVDGLSLLIGLLASGVGVLVFTYSGGYMHGEPGQLKYYATLLAFMGSMLGVAFAADLITLFLFWEFTSVSSFLLIGHYQDDAASQYAARKSMLITVSGGLFMLVGFLLLHAVSAEALGSATFRLAGEGSMLAGAEAMRTALTDAGLFVPVLLLIAIGAAAKSAQVPLHIWLPNAMEAPTPVSAFLHSATMVKAGVYLVGRFRPLLLTDQWLLVFAVLGLVTMTITAILAVGATDIKELLAYSTASHLGLIIAGFGITNVYGAETGAFHILNHAVFKATLFLVAGIVAHEAHTRAIDDLGGLRKDLPITAGITVIAALGMAGVPPFNGFYSKELLFEATYEVAHETVAHGGSALWWLLPVVAVFGSVFTFLYSIKFASLFFGEQTDHVSNTHVHRPPTAMLGPPLLLAAIASVIGIGGITGTFGVHLGPLEGFVGRVAESSVPTGGKEIHFSYYIPTKLTPAATMSVVTIALGAVAYPFYDRLHDGVRWLWSIPVLSPNWYYDTATGALDSSTLVEKYVQTGSLRTYATALFLSVSGLTLASYVATSVSLPPLSLSGGVTLPLMLVLSVAMVAAVAVEIAPSHVAGVLTLSILGFMVAIFYILAEAPDLALTQLLIETLVLIIFLLVLDQLPAFYGEQSVRKTAGDVLVASFVGVTVFLTVVLSTAATPKDVIARFLVERAGVPAEHGPVFTDYGGGSNIVNVILVDFRAFDTMGEISVVAMAALSVVTIIAMRERGEAQ